MHAIIAAITRCIGSKRDARHAACTSLRQNARHDEAEITEYIRRRKKTAASARPRNEGHLYFTRSCGDVFNKMRTLLQICS